MAEEVIGKKGVQEWTVTRELLASSNEIFRRHFTDYSLPKTTGKQCRI